MTRKTDLELVQELTDAHHYEAAERLQQLTGEGKPIGAWGWDAAEGRAIHIPSYRLGVERERARIIAGNYE